MQEKREKNVDKELTVVDTALTMSKELSLAQKVRALKIGQHFTVDTKSDRQKVCRVAKALKDAGVIEFDIVTKRDGEGFKVAAI